ncbi:MAG: ABC transporter permease subunit [Deltaproteobacteria bacterium]
MATLSTRIEKKPKLVLGIDKRRLADKAATVVVTFGGIAIILSIAAILLFISLEVYPLWKGAEAQLTGKFDVKRYAFLPQNPESGFEIAALGVEEYQEVGYFITKSGVVSFISLSDGTLVKEERIEGLDGRRLASAQGSINSKNFTLATEDGIVLPIEIKSSASFSEGGTRTLALEVVEGDLIEMDSVALKRAAHQTSDEGARASAAITGDGRLLLAFEREAEESEFGGLEEAQTEVQSPARTKALFDLTPELSGSAPTEIALDEFMDNLYVGVADGRIFRWDLKDKSAPKLAESTEASANKTPITALGFILGDRSLIVGDASGGVSIWFQIEDKTSPTGRRLVKAHTLSSHKSEVVAVAASPRDRGLLTADAEGNLILHYSTAERKLLEIQGDGRAIKALAFAPKANGALAVDGGGTLMGFGIDNPHPEITLRSLFGRIWYEGYSEPEYVWQSTGGTDDFEPKLSLTPLAYGTFKGTLYALLFAVPVGILGAICVSQFMHPSLRNLIKPVIETMAALPSVVLGFVAGLLIAPLIEGILPAVLLMPFMIVALILVSVFIWRLVPRGVRGKFKEGTELLLMIPVFLLGIQICLWLNAPLESFMFGGDYRNWLFSVLGLQYDQRNSLVVGLAMGFAVIPIIFTISEDSLSNVPRHLVSGSLALGATKWQTAIQVVLPTASAGIFSAVMIGLGRAVGETMIVLMATGNTPIIDWSIFNGFRALSANIAVEIPEAPEGGTLYRVLFLAALLLFFVTFIVNTAAELVRQRLRKKYGQL